MKKVIHIYSSENNFWKEGIIEGKEFENTLELTNETKQTVKGFGGCFNEISWNILKKVDENKRKEILDNLFTEKGLNFNVGRLPIGASDYALEWHSYDETDGDYELKDFSIKRDKEYLSPYLKEALNRKPEMSLFASTWSPPTWMKTKKAYSFGILRWVKENLQSYANYFAKYVD